MSQQIGKVIGLSDPLIRLSGLDSVSLGQILSFESGSQAIVTQFSSDHVSAVLLSGSLPSFHEGATLTKGTLATDGQTETTILKALALSDASGRVAFHHPAPDHTQRSALKSQLITGIAQIDVLLPLAHGQRQLLIGDRKTGKTSLALSIALSQAEFGTQVVYGLIGKSRAQIASIARVVASDPRGKQIQLLVSSPDEAPGEILQVPFAAMALAETWRDTGKPVLVILDDMTTHARFHRQVGLLSEAFPGRDSYPSDLFFTYARLFERAGVVATSAGQTPITCLALAETVESDLSDFLISTLISITDGHYLLSESLFRSGVRPALNIPLSVTRVGKQTQTPLTRQLNHALTAELSSIEKARSMSHFSGELPAQVAGLIQKGARYQAVLTQPDRSSQLLPVAAILLGAIYTNALGNLDAASTHKAKTKLSAAYESDAKVRELVDRLASSSSLEEFSRNLQTSIATLRSACGI